MIHHPPHTSRRDLYAAAAAVWLVTAAVLVGRHIQDAHHTLFVHWPPLFADWDPHVGPGTPAALILAAAGVAYGPPLAARLPWRALPWAVWAASAAWIVSLALIDGWHDGIARRLTTANEYLQVIGRFHDIPATLRGFDGHILAGVPGNWPAHVAGHPPAATLTFVLLDRIGLGGGGWAGMWCVVLGASAAAAVLVTVRALAGEPLARRAAPFLVLAPAAVWMGASADAYFAAVAAWALACLALALTRRSLLWAAASGLLAGLTCYLSYGLTLIALIGLAVLVLARADLRARPLLVLPFLAGLAVVPVVFALYGFNWWTAYHLLVTRYYQGVGGTRPYSYWIWANLACAAIITGPATAAALPRTAGSLLHRNDDRPAARLALIVCAALAGLLIADLSGMSKAETERIWLPFAVWLLAAGALLPRPRAWLAAQVTLALLINHLLLTGW
ncbi:hypothetical protein D0Z67_26715 [Streptomyces seoulensis]|uniref:Glycosyltransferase family 39 protein n=1 Tax=Streptomyces seoulensis TaxID=73044 RepID=A0A4P6U2N2_STRSO|nr:hypothetical protein [Streptomyces seoulensis]QBJ93517.1 hypothetical protein D0Z67_26715 [Streptomyces seoulensis]